MEKIELLAPAGDLQRLKVAVDYGADAVFLGGKRFSLRSRASNFDLAMIEEGVRYAHQRNARIHVTVNMILHDDDFDGLEDYLRALEAIGVDAIIVASFAVVEVAKRVAPSLEIHISTQYSITNSETIAFYKELGASRVVLAREVTLDELKALSKTSSLPLEAFIHGGMCVNYSGRCTLSNYMTLRDANRGGCAQSCRWKYHLYDADHREVSKPTCLFSMSSKDLNAIDVLPDLIDMKVASLKIEGRMKTDFYIATVVGAYRKAIDALYGHPEDKEAILLACKKELLNAENRETSSGFYLHRPQAKDHLYGVNGAGVNQNFVGKILSYDPKTHRAQVQIRNHFTDQDLLEIMSPQGISIPFKARAMVDSQGQQTQRFYKPMEEVSFEIDFPVEVDAYLRKALR